MGNTMLIIVAVVTIAMLINKSIERIKNNREFRYGYIRVEDNKGNKYMVARDKDNQPSGKYYQQLIKENGPLKVC